MHYCIQRNYDNIPSDRDLQISAAVSLTSIESRQLKAMDDKVIAEALRNTFLTMLFTGLFGVGVLFAKGKTSAIEFLVSFYR